MKRKWTKVIILLMIGGLLFLGSQASATEVNIAVPADPDTFDTHRTTAAATTEIAFNIYEGLVKATPQGDIAPALATHWEVNADNTRYTFHLREALFHNGQPVTAADVVSAINKARDPKVSRKAGEYQAIEEVYAEAGKVIIQLEQAYSPFLAIMADIAVAIYPQDATDQATNPIGTGPYRFVEWHPNQYIKLERFANHWSGEEPYFSEAYFRILPDDTSSVLSLKTGQIDIIPRLEPSLLHQVESDKNLKIIASPMNLVQLLAVNNKRPPFDDIRVRQALALAIDKQEIIYGAAWGHGSRLTSGISPAMETFYSDMGEGPYSYNPSKAGELLNESGHQNLKVTLDLPAPYALHVQAGEIIAQQLSKVGFDVKINIIEWGTWLERVYTQRDYDLTIVGLTGKLAPHSILVRYTSDSSRNFFNFSNQQYDQLIEEALAANQDQQIVLYKEAQEVLATEVAGVFLMDPNQLAVMDHRIKGWSNYPIYVVDIASLYR